MSNDRVNVKTKEAAEKAIKAGLAINIIAGSFTLSLVDVNISIWVSGTSAPRIVTWGTSAPRIETWGTSAPSIVTWGTSAPSIVTRGTSAPSIVTRGTSAPRIETWGTSAPSIVTRETSAPRIETWETSAPRIETRGTSAPRIETWGTSAPRIETWGTSAPRIETWETSAPRIVTRETSAPRIETWGTSAPRIDANGYSSVFTRGDRLKGKGSANSIFRIQGAAQIKGGHQFKIELITARDWCEYYGARIEGENAVVYKAVGNGYMSAHGCQYTPGSMPEDKAWNGRKDECERGCGLNFSPTPQATHQFVSEPKHYLECRIALAEMVVHFNGAYPEKCTAQRVTAPLIECDIDGNIIEEAVR